MNNTLNYLSSEYEYNIIYLSYFKEGSQFKTIDDIAEELHISNYSVYKHKQLAKKKMEQYFLRIDIKERVALNRVEFEDK